MSHVSTARPRRQASPAVAIALDFGLRVRVDGHASQRTLFSGAENLSLRELCSELGLMISKLRVRSFALSYPAAVSRRMPVQTAYGLKPQTPRDVYERCMKGFGCPP